MLATLEHLPAHLAQRPVRSPDAVTCSAERAVLLRRIDGASCVPGPWFGGLVGVEERHLCAVAESLSDERGRAFEDKFADGAVAGAEEVDAELAETVHHGVRMEMAAGEGAREEPWAIWAGGGAEVGP